MGTVDGIDLDLFASGSSIKKLRVACCDDIPTVAGVYVVARVAPGAPEFRLVSSAGLFKQQDPSYPPDVVQGSFNRSSQHPEIRELQWQQQNMVAVDVEFVQR
jgi:hypothetical protein